jgi:hypothetical protein
LHLCGQKLNAFLFTSTLLVVVNPVHTLVPNYESVWSTMSLLRSNYVSLSSGKESKESVKKVSRRSSLLFSPSPPPLLLPSQLFSSENIQSCRILLDLRLPFVPGMALCPWSAMPSLLQFGVNPLIGVVCWGWTKYKRSETRLTRTPSTAPSIGNP